jgi:transcriptional regulator with XRE-family HTH domain
MEDQAGVPIRWDPALRGAGGRLKPSPRSPFSCEPSSHTPSPTSHSHDPDHNDIDFSRKGLYSPRRGVTVPKPPKEVVLSRKGIGARLLSLRPTHDTTQVHLAKVLGTQQTAVSRVEPGNRGLTIQQVVKLAKALHVSTGAILGPTNGAPHDELPRDRRLLRRLRQIERLPRPERQALLRTIDAFLKSSRVAQARG